jgi:methionyl-tRNA formyltransferase
LSIHRVKPTFTLVSDSTTGSALAEGFINSGCNCIGVISHSPDSLRVGTTGLQNWASTQQVSYSECTSSDDALFYRIATQGNPGFLVVSWPELLDTEKLTSNKVLAIGLHPAPLPLGRGRHPLHWTLAMGLKRLVVSFFALDSGVDTGAVLLQMSAKLNGSETLKELRVLHDSLARAGAEKLGDWITRGRQLKSKPQDANATYWRKRTEHDITIDFRMSSRSIADLVRSFGQPFEGCRVLTGVGPLSIETCEILTNMTPVDKWQVPGTVLYQDSNTLVVRTSDGLVRLSVRANAIWANFQNSRDRFLHPPSFYNWV